MRQDLHANGDRRHRSGAGGIRGPGRRGGGKAAIGTGPRTIELRALPEAQKGRRLGKVAAAVNMSRRLYTKAAARRRGCEADKDAFRPDPGADGTNPVKSTGAHKKLVQVRKEAAKAGRSKADQCARERSLNRTPDRC